MNAPHIAGVHLKGEGLQPELVMLCSLPTRVWVPLQVEYN